VDSFKCMGCWRFYDKIEGHHLEVSRDFLKNYKSGKTKVGPLEIHLTVDLIAEVTDIPRIGELWFKAKKLENED
jgi:ethanolamine ammonia-lyase large subunit